MTGLASGLVTMSWNMASRSSLRGLKRPFPRPGCACLPGVQRLWQAPPKIWAFLGTVLQTHTQAYHA